MRPSHVERYKEKRRRRGKAIVLIGLLAFFTFLAITLFGDSGILVNLRVKQEYQALKSERDRLQLENQRLRNEILELKTSPRKIEAVGRNTLGFGRPGEIIYYFPDKSDQAIQKETR